MNASAELLKELRIDRSAAPPPRGPSSSRRWLWIVLGLVAALTSLATAHAEATGVVVRRDLQPVPDLGWAAELVVYRIAQEALTNSAKHAQASTVTLSLHCDQDTVRLVIADDGRGLQGSTPGTGLASMHDRARSINAQLTITDNPGGGTRVELRIDRGTLPHDSLPED